MCGYVCTLYARPTSAIKTCMIDSQGQNVACASLLTCSLVESEIASSMLMTCCVGTLCSLGTPCCAPRAAAAALACANLYLTDIHARATSIITLLECEALCMVISDVWCILKPLVLTEVWFVIISTKDGDCAWCNGCVFLPPLSVPAPFFNQPKQTELRNQTCVRAVYVMVEYMKHNTCVPVSAAELIRDVCVS